MESLLLTIPRSVFWHACINQPGPILFESVPAGRSSKATVRSTIRELCGIGMPNYLQRSRDDKVMIGNACDRLIMDGRTPDQ